MSLNSEKEYPLQAANWQQLSDNWYQYDIVWFAWLCFQDQLSVFKPVFNPSPSVSEK